MWENGLVCGSCSCFCVCVCAEDESLIKTAQLEDTTYIRSVAALNNWLCSRGEVRERKEGV